MTWLELLVLGVCLLVIMAAAIAVALVVLAPDDDDPIRTEIKNRLSRLG